MKKFLGLMVLAACGGEPALEAGGFRLTAKGEGFVLKRPDGGVLLESAGAIADYAPVAYRNVKPKIEMSYGSFKFTEGRGAWTEGRKVEIDGKVAKVKNGETVVAELSLSAPAEGVVRLEVQSRGESVNRTSLAFACSDSDRFLGFGGQADGVDHKGHTLAMWTSEPGIGKQMEDDEYPAIWQLVGQRHATSYPIPSFLSNRGFIAVLDYDGRSVFEMCSVQKSAFRIETWGPSSALVLYTGDTPAQSLERATAGLLGRPPQPPAVAFAPWNDAIYGTASVRKIAAELRDAGVPSSVLWTEDFRGGRDTSMGYRLDEEWDTDFALYPDAGQFADELRANGFSWHAYFNTFLVEGTRVFAAAEAGKHFVSAPDGGSKYLFDAVTFKPTGLADLSKPATRDWVKSYLRDAVNLGFDGWMADYAEWLPADAVLASGEDAMLAHNRYPREWVKLNWEVQHEKPTTRPLLFFARAGWTGSTRYTPVVWGGDQRTSFQRDDGLFTVIPMGLNLGLGGVSTYGHDIAGYQSSTNPPSNKELFFRWTTLGALSPVMRTHHGLSARQNHAWNTDAETVAHFRRWAQFHIQLFPYFDGASVEAETKGLPLMRAMALAFPADEAGWALSDQYLLGPSLLVAPIVDAGATKRTVHLPPGRWWPLQGGAAIDGPKEHEATAPVTEIPVFVRAGSVIPLLPEEVKTLLPVDGPLVDLDDVKNRRVLRLFPGGEGVFTERDGTRYTVTLDPGADAPREGSTPLSSCATAASRGCVNVGTARLSGQGPFFARGVKLEVTGPARTLDVVLPEP